MPLVSFDTPRKHQKTSGFQEVSKENSGMKWVNHSSQFIVLGVQIRGFLFNRVRNLKPVQQTRVFIKFIFFSQFRFYNFH